MSTNSNFTIAVHILTLITHHARPLSSSFIAGSVNTNPVTIRKLVSKLKEADLVRTIPGSAGGTVLGKSPGDISLKDIYDVFKDDTLFGLYPDEPNPQCIVGRNLQVVLLAVFDDTEALLSTFLENITLVDIRNAIISQDKESS